MDTTLGIQKKQGRKNQKISSPLRDMTPYLAQDKETLKEPYFRKVKIGLIGLNFGRHIVKDILEKPASDYFELTAVCDKDRGRFDALPNRHLVNCYDDIDTMLADEDIEAVGLFTGPRGRADLMQKIIRSGRHIITTKPLESNSGNALKALTEAQEHGIIIHCNSPSVTAPEDLRTIELWQRLYGLGRPIGARASIWSSYRETEDGTWYDNPDACPAAPLYRLGIYLINDLVRLWGRVAQVQLLQTRLFTGRPTSDNAQMGIRFENGALADIFASFCINDGQPYGNQLTLHYENGTVYRNSGPAWSESSQGRCQLAVVQSKGGGAKVVASAAVDNRSGYYQWEEFARTVRGKPSQSSLSPSEMVEGVRVIEALQMAQNCGGMADIVR